MQIFVKLSQKTINNQEKKHKNTKIKMGDQSKRAKNDPKKEKMNETLKLRYDDETL